MVRRPCVRVHRSVGEEVRRRLAKEGILDPRYKPFERNGYIYFPITRRERLEEVLEEEFEERVSGPRTLKEALEKKLPEGLLEKVPSSYDIVGEIAVIELPRELKPYERAVGEALMSIHPRVRTVLAKGGTRGIFRVRELRVIAGSGTTETTHREHGCIYKLDLARMFFNPRMSGERLRIARMVKPGEKVLDMFAGVGPFSILIAKLQPDARILAIELNPEAYKYLLKNIEVNKVKDRVRAVWGNVGEVLRNLKENFDRIIMDLPRDSLKYLPIALKRSKAGAVIHLYWNGSDTEEAFKDIGKIAEKHGRDLKLLNVRRVMETAPRTYTWAIDMEVSS